MRASIRNHLTEKLELLSTKVIYFEGQVEVDQVWPERAVEMAAELKRLTDDIMSFTSQHVIDLIAEKSQEVEEIKNVEEINITDCIKNTFTMELNNE